MQETTNIEENCPSLSPLFCPEIISLISVAPMEMPIHCLQYSKVYLQVTLDDYEEALLN